MKNMMVKDWMTKRVITVAPETSLPDAHRLMKINHIRRLPVVDKKGRILGIVTLGDIREASPSDATTLSVWELHYLLSKLTVGKIMTPNPITVKPDSTIREAAQLMLEHKIGGLPVVDDDKKVVGIITESDIFRLLVEELKECDVTVQS